MKNGTSNVWGKDEGRIHLKGIRRKIRGERCRGRTEVESLKGTEKQIQSNPRKDTEERRK